jgi:hypothetical protein
VKPLPRSKSAAIQQSKKQTKDAQKDIFKKSPRYLQLSSVDPSLLSGNFLKLVNSLPKRHTVVLFQLRASHAPLNKHLYRIKRSPTPNCSNCNSGRHETTPHLLLDCPKFKLQRAWLRGKVKDKARNLSALLNDPKCIKHTLAFLQATERLTQTFGNINPPKDAV